MDPLQVSAQFAAFTWFAAGKPETAQTEEAARRFAQDNWLSFLPCAHKGWGELLIRVAEPSPARKRRRPLAMAV